MEQIAMATISVGRIDEQPFFQPWIGDQYAAKLKRVANGDLNNGGLHRGYHQRPLSVSSV